MVRLVAWYVRLRYGGFYLQDRVNDGERDSRDESAPRDKRLVKKLASSLEETRRAAIHFAE